MMDISIIILSAANLYLYIYEAQLLDLHDLRLQLLFYNILLMIHYNMLILLINNITFHHSFLLGLQHLYLYICSLFFQLLNTMISQYHFIKNSSIIVHLNLNILALIILMNHFQIKILLFFPLFLIL